MGYDRPGPWLSEGFALSRGSAWRIFWVILVIGTTIGIAWAAALSRFYQAVAGDSATLLAF